jgi:two-component system NarL family sensor kinase
VNPPRSPRARPVDDTTVRLKAKLILLAAVPLLLSLALIAAAVRTQSQELARREHLLVERAYMAARQAELKHYVELAMGMVRALRDQGSNTADAQREALRLLSLLSYGDDGYFFVYDLQGRVLMHSRQPDLVGQNLWTLRDLEGQQTIQQLIARARSGGGYVPYLWRKPSSGQMARKLGYVVTVPNWDWMIGTGLYLDDIDATMSELDRQAGGHIRTTLLWIAGIAALGIGLLTASGVWLNLSEHKVTDAKLRLLARQVVQSQEDERAHLARELHDGTSQTLVSAKLQIEAAMDKLGRGERAVVLSLAKALARLNDSLDEVRRISHRLRPAMLDTLGLPAALELLGREWGEHSLARVRVRIEGAEFELPAEVKTALFRVAQEGMTNIGKHADAATVDIVLSFDAHSLRLDIRDDGCGFDAAAVQLDPRRGIGLRNMRERMASIGGRFEVQSGPGNGTWVVASVPVDAIERLRKA